MSRNTIVLCMALPAVVACAGGPAPRSSAPLPSSVVAGGTPTVIVDSIAARLADVEIARAQALAVYEPWATAVRHLDAQVAAYQEQLLAISLTAAPPRRVIQYVLNRLDERQSALTLRHRQLLVMYKPESPEVRNLVAEAEQLRERRAELGASLQLGSERGGEE